MADTVRTISDLLTNLFQDGQADGSITAQDMRDLIVSFRPSEGGMYMEGNASATTVAAATTWYKIAGSTTAYSDLQDFSMPSNNRLVYADTVTRHMTVAASFTVTSVSNNQVGEICIYKNGVKVDGSTVEFKCLAIGDPTSVSLVAQLDMDPNDYIEFYIQNETGANNMTVSYLNASIQGHVH